MRKISGGEEEGEEKGKNRGFSEKVVMGREEFLTKAGSGAERSDTLRHFFRRARGKTDGRISARHGGYDKIIAVREREQCGVSIASGDFAALATTTTTTGRRKRRRIPNRR